MKMYILMEYITTTITSIDGGITMKSPFSRRRCLKCFGAGAALIFSRSGESSAQAAAQKLAIDRSHVSWGDRPMYLRAYHPPYVVTYYGARNERKTVKWDPIIARVEHEPDLMIRIIEAFDDACAGCEKLKPDPLGSVWGVGYTCSSAQNPDTVASVTRTNRRILGELGLYFGSEIKFRDIVPLLEKNVPVLYDGIGGPDNQEMYEKGLRDLKIKYGL